MIELHLKRNYFENQTEGILELHEGDDLIYKCYTLELAWKDNKKGISCIPEGVYKVVRQIQTTRGKILRILDVPGRDGVLIHRANYSRQLNGCIAPGEALIDIDKDGLMDVTNSVKTCNEIYDLLTDDIYKLTITS